MTITIRTLITFVILNLSLYALARRLIGIPFEWLKLGGVLAVCVVLYFFGSYRIYDSVWASGAKAFLVWISYPVVLSFIGIISREERTKVLSVANNLRRRILAT